MFAAARAGVCALCLTRYSTLMELPMPAFVENQIHKTHTHPRVLFPFTDRQIWGLLPHGKKPMLCLCKTRVPPLVPITARCPNRIGTYSTVVYRQAYPNILVPVAPLLHPVAEFVRQFGCKFLSIWSYIFHFVVFCRTMP